MIELIRDSKPSNDFIVNRGQEKQTNKQTNKSKHLIQNKIILGEPKQGSSVVRAWHWEDPGSSPALIIFFISLVNWPK